ncbi:unnamed protein product, partial [Mesorhabditis spiculigera]
MNEAGENANNNGSPDDPSLLEGVDNICQNIIALREKYQLTPANIKSMLKQLYKPEVMAQVLDPNGENISALKLTRSRVQKVQTKDDSKAQVPVARAQRTFLTVDYADEDQFDDDYVPENDPAGSQDEELPESSSSSAFDSDDDSAMELQRELEKELEALNGEPTQRSELISPIPHAASLTLDLSDMMHDSPSTSRAATVDKRPNLNQTAGQDALREETQELFASYNNPEVFTAVDPDYLTFCSSLCGIGTGKDFFGDDDDPDDTEFIPNPEEIEHELETDPLEVRRDRATEIPRKETDFLYTDLTDAETALMLQSFPKNAVQAEIIKTKKHRPQAEQRTNEDDSADVVVLPKPSYHLPYPALRPNTSDSLLPANRSIRFRREELTQLRIQLEQHTQLLAQSAVAMSFDNHLYGRKPIYAMMRELEDLYTDYGPGSIFDVSNMASAIDLTHTALKLQKSNDWEPNNYRVTSGRFLLPRLRPEACYLLMNSPAILYPALVPQVSMHNAPEVTSPLSDSEDLLLLFGLVQFGHLTKRRSRVSISGINKISFIARHLLAGREERQIVTRLKKLRANFDTGRILQAAESGHTVFQIAFQRPLRYPGTMRQWPASVRPDWFSWFEQNWTFTPDGFLVTRQTLAQMIPYPSPDKWFFERIASEVSPEVPGGPVNISNFHVDIGRNPQEASCSASVPMANFGTSAMSFSALEPELDYDFGHDDDSFSALQTEPAEHVSRIPEPENDTDVIVLDETTNDVGVLKMGEPGPEIPAHENLAVHQSFSEPTKRRSSPRKFSNAETQTDYVRILEGPEMEEPQTNADQPTETRTSTRKRKPANPKRHSAPSPDAKRTERSSNAHPGEAAGQPIFVQETTEPSTPPPAAQKPVEEMSTPSPFHVVTWDTLISPEKRAKPPDTPDNPPTPGYSAEVAERLVRSGIRTPSSARPLRRGRRLFLDSPAKLDQTPLRAPRKIPTPEKPAPAPEVEEPQRLTDDINLQLIHIYNDNLGEDLDTIATLATERLNVPFQPVKERLEFIRNFCSQDS